MSGEFYPRRYYSATDDDVAERYQELVNGTDDEIVQTYLAAYSPMSDLDNSAYLDSLRQALGKIVRERNLWDRIYAEER